MHKIIGDLQIFAIEIEILSFDPSLYGRSALWINGEKIGVFEDENYLGQLIWSFDKITKQKNEFWDAELEGLTGIDLFLAITPFFENELDLYNHPNEELEKYEKYDNYLILFGENYDKWLIKIVIKNNICVFFWYLFPDITSGVDNIDMKFINFSEIELPIIIKAYEGLLDFIPEDFWPKQIG